MLTKARMIELLRAAGKYCAHEMYTDEEGLGFLLDPEKPISPRTLRMWRSEKKGPSATLIKRWLYDLDAVVEWVNAGAFANSAGGERREAEDGGKTRKTVA